MSNFETQTPQEPTTPIPDERDDFMQTAARRGRGLLVPTLVTTGIVGVAGVAWLQAQQREASANILTQQQEITPNFLASISALSKESAILATTQIVFEVGSDGKLYQQTLNELQTNEQFKEDYPDNKNLINKTLLESTSSLGPYKEGEDIGVTRLLVDDIGQVTYITQRITEESASLTIDDWGPRIERIYSNLEAPTESTTPDAESIPTPETH